jgi:hypothetical protein
MLELPSDQEMVEGFVTLDRGIPWMVPEAILKLDEVLNGDDIVLEVGTGGSTFFFAKRCNKVAAFETSKEWYENVVGKLDMDGITNVSYVFEPSEEEICVEIKPYSLDMITVFSVDPQGGYNRSRILNSFLEEYHPNLRIIILDNYSHIGLFPLHHDKILDLGEGWDVFTYNHPRWAGSGTRLYIKK